MEYHLVARDGALGRQLGRDRPDRIVRGRDKHEFGTRGRFGWLPE